jgi:hypothetical protein
MLLCRTGLMRCSEGVLWTNQLKPKARFFCPLLSRIASASGKITNAFAAAPSRLFYLISPEAARLTA